MGIRGFIHALVRAGRVTVELDADESDNVAEFTLRDVFGPFASSQIVYGSEEANEVAKSWSARPSGPS